MKNEKKTPASKEIKTGPGSNPVNKFKKGSTGIKDTGIISSAVESVKAKSGKTLANEGPNVDYTEER
jgi:hypothetical protein